MRKRDYREQYILNNSTFLLLNNTLSAISGFEIRGVNARAHESNVREHVSTFSWNQ